MLSFLPMLSLKLETRQKKSQFWLYFAPVLALLLSVLFGIAAFYLLGYPALESLQAFFFKPFGSLYNLGELSIKSVPLILIALGLAISFRAGIWNIGGEGQFILGAIGASAVSLYFFDKSGFWLMPAIWLFAILAGMFWAALPALFKSRFNVNEILSSLMLNYIAFLLLAYLVQGIFKDPEGFNFPESKLFHSAALLPVILEGTRLHLGVLITPLLLFGMWLILQRTLLGFQVQVLGYSHNAAAYSGVSQKKLLWISMLLGGGFAGLAGMMEVNGAVGQINATFTTGYGYTAIIVAFLGRLHPVGIFFAGILMAGSYLGGEIAQIELGFPKAVTGIFQGCGMAADLCFKKFDCY